MITPRPILKTRPSPSCECFPSPATALPFKFPTSPHVHFPPTPTMTDTQVTHSSFVYDRAPIVVLPNACKLPERGGRNYNTCGSMASSSAPPKEGYFDYPSPIQSDPEHEQPPPLIHDLSSASESDDSESDTCLSPEPNRTYTHSFDIPANLSKQEQDIMTYPPTPTPLNLQPQRKLYFLPHPLDFEARLPQRPKPKRKQTGPSRVGPSSLNVEDSFAGSGGELSLDGCLGGF